MYRGSLIISGKTKSVYQMYEDEELKTRLCGHMQTDLCEIESKDDITAGDGARHDIVSGKAEIATATTVGIFRFLQGLGIDVAFERQTGKTTFLAPECEMLPFEVIVRREAHGSHCKRYPHLQKGTRLSRLLVQFYLKTSGRRFGEHLGFPCDDPLVSFVLDEHGIPVAMKLFVPNTPANKTEPFAELPVPNEIRHSERVKDMAEIAARAFLVLESAWQQYGIRLVDYKVEFGLDGEGTLLLADVIDADSGRLVGPDGAYIDKQVYRDGGSIDEVYRNYLAIQKMVERFHQPAPSHVVAWAGSEHDDVGNMTKHFVGIDDGENLIFETIVCSGHKQTLRAIELLRAIEQNSPNTVIIACVGRSNGLGPILAANSKLPVISVPASADTFPDDVWSSLRMPSNLPHMTVLDRKNAVLAALRILSIGNPYVYMAMHEAEGKYYEIGS